MEIHPEQGIVAQSPLSSELPPTWQCRATKIFVVDGRSSLAEYRGPWKKTLRLRVELSSLIPLGPYPSGVPSSKVIETSRLNEKPLLAIEHPVYSGLWSILVVDEDRRVVHCLVKKYDKDNYHPKEYAVAVPLEGGMNLTVSSPAGTAPQFLESPEEPQSFTVAIAPPLYFTTRASIFTVDEISTINQHFRAKGYCELRLRGFSAIDDAELAELVLNEFSFNVDMIDVIDVVEHVCDEEREHGLVFSEGNYDMVFKLNFHVVLPETFELHQFPFDDQDLHFVITLHHPEPLTRFVKDRHFPSLFVEKSFRFRSEFHVSFRNQVHSEIGSSDPSDSMAGSIYPRIHFRINLRRKPQYILINIVLPMLVLTALTSISIGVRAVDGSRMDTGDRLGVTLTLLLTAVAFKLVMASELPQVSYLTLLDKYLLGCNLWILVAAIENVAFPSFGYDRSGDEPKERFNEWYLFFAYLGLFFLGNCVFWWWAISRARTRKQEIDASYAAEAVSRRTKLR